MRFGVVPAALLCFVAAGCNPPSDPGSYPSKTVTIICPWAAGGGTDRVSRFWADALENELGGSFVVVNRTGGSGNTGHSAGAKAKPDGHTITTITFELSTMHQMGISDLTYKDFRCIMQINADAAAIIVQKDAPWRDLGQLLDDIRKRPEKLKMSGTATGGAWDLARAGFLRAAGLSIDSVIWVPTDGAQEGLFKLIGGHVDAVCCSVPEAAPQISSGELRVLAVMADERLEEFPDTPTLHDLNIDWSAVGWRGLAVPKDTPDDIVEKLTAACMTIAQSDAFKEFMSENGFGIRIRNSEDFTEFLAQQDERWKPVVDAFLNQ